MEEIRKTAPVTFVGANVGQSSNNTTVSISDKSEKVKWLSDDKKIDECWFTIDVKQLG